jgi:hypothetical protein
MLNEPCIPVIQRLAAGGRSLIEAEREAVLMVLEVIVLWALMGFAAPAHHAGILPEHPLRAPARGQGSSVHGDSIISSCITGTSRVLLRE